MQTERTDTGSNSNASMAKPRGATHLGLAVLSAACAWALLTAAAAPAANVTVGSPLTATFASANIGSISTLVNSSLGEPGSNVTSPTDGLIVRWRVQGAAGGPFRLRVVTPVSGATYTGGGSTGPGIPLGLDVETFSAALPIKAGQSIGLDNTASGDKIGIAGVPGSAYVFWNPQLGDGATTTGTGPGSGAELAFNAEIQPPPTVSSVAPASGTFQGGTGVVIAGSDFVGVKGVSFGTTPAQSFGVGSEGQITAVAPPAAGPGAVDVTVTTIAGKSTARPAGQFTYTACIVPKLKQKKLKGARKALRNAGCTLGTVKRTKNAGKRAKLIKQSAKPTTFLPPGAKVNVKLGK
jgi:hypothetical protein